jgi:hypothetical protein
MGGQSVENFTVPILQYLALVNIKDVAMMILMDVLQMSCKVCLCLRMDGTGVTQHSLQSDKEYSLHLESPITIKGIFM